MELPPKSPDSNNQSDAGSGGDVVDLNAWRKSRVASAIGKNSLRGQNLDDSIMKDHPAYRAKLKREALQKQSDDDLNDPDDTPDQPA